MKQVLFLVLLTLISLSSEASNETEYQKKLLMQVASELELLDELVKKAQIASVPGEASTFEFSDLRADLKEQARAI